MTAFVDARDSNWCLLKAGRNNLSCQATRFRLIHLPPSVVVLGEVGFRNVRH
jgi:hypothetical protein